MNNESQNIADGPLLHFGHIPCAELLRLRGTLGQSEVGRFVRVDTTSYCPADGGSHGVLLQVQPVAASLLASSLKDGMLRQWGALFEARHGVEFQKKVLAVRALLTGKNVVISGGSCQNETGRCTKIAVTPDSDSINIVLENGNRSGLAIDTITASAVSGRICAGGGFVRTVQLTSEA